MARKTGALFTGETIIARSSLVEIAADSATLIDANILPAQCLDCSGYDTIFVGVEITVPGTAAMTIEALFRDADQLDGARYSRLLVGAPAGVTALAAIAAEKTSALVNGSQFAELRVFGHRLVYLRVDAVANVALTTGYKLLVRPGQVRGDRRIALPG